MIIPHRLDLHIRRNANPWRHRINIYDNAGAPVDMRGHHGRMQVRWYEGQEDDPVAALSREMQTAFSHGASYSDGTVHESSDSGNSSRINFDEQGIELVITQLDLLRFPFAGPLLPVMWFSYDILISRMAPAGGYYSADNPDYDENAWFEGKVVFHNGVVDPKYERRPCPFVLEDLATGAGHHECKRGIGDVCAEYSPWGCLWFSMPRNVPTKVLRNAIWPDAA